MKAHIVLAHPEPRSFNAHLTDISRQALDEAGWQTTLSDLYAMGFDPREGPQHYPCRKDAEIYHAQTEQRHNADNQTLPIEVESEIQYLLECDLLIVHFPLWWFGMPAILKGWMDRVFVYGRMYRSVMRYDKGICFGKKVIACVTTGASEESCSYNGKEGDTQLHLWPILFPFRYLGFEVYKPEVFHGVGGVAFIENNDSGFNKMEIYSKRWLETLSTLSSRSMIQYNSDEDFDETKRLIHGASVYSPFIRRKSESFSD